MIGYALHIIRFIGGASGLEIVTLCVEDRFASLDPVSKILRFFVASFGFYEDMAEGIDLRRE